MLPNTSEVLAFFNLLVGLMLVVSVLLFVGGFIMYLIRLGTWPTYRDEALKLMEYGVAVLFTLIILLIVQQFLMSHLLVAVTLVAFVIVIAVVLGVASEFKSAPPPRPERPERPAP